MSGWIPQAIETLVTVVNTALPKLAPEEIEDTMIWVEMVDAKLSPFALADHADSSLKDLIVRLAEDDDDDTISVDELEEDESTDANKISKATSNGVAKENQAPNSIV